ncbi:MAG: HlyD family efflux transporter periplasmic adaptor subunit [Treponema sp.]|nr:HlyD family efflux transporter periplasmic adaptor subunit [Treponema sp.]
MNGLKFSAKQKMIGISVIALIVLTCGLFGARRIVAAKKSASSVQYTVRSEIYENVIEIAGTVSAAKEQSLEALNDGTVVGVYVKEGDHVKKGDLILQEDDSEQKYNLAKLDYDIATAKTSGARGEIALLETQRLSLVRKIKDRKIVATFDGVIASLDVNEGDYLEAKDEIGTLVDTSYLTAEVEIAETDVYKLKPGQKVEFTFPAYSGTVEGYLVSYPAIGEVTSRGATVVNAKVRIDNAPEAILPNFSFTGKIQITEPESKLVVERYAIGHEKGSTFVEILEANGKTQKVEVEVEPYGIGYVNIKSGLEGGEKLKAQSSASKSGRMRINSRNANSKNQRQQQNGMNGGFGAPPPGGF